MRKFLSWPGVSSIQMTFHEDQAPELHSMPPGGFRLAIINCWNAEIGFKVRDLLAMMFGSSDPMKEPIDPTAIRGSMVKAQRSTWPNLEL
jgi:hypothetical protein